MRPAIEAGLMQFVEAATLLMKPVLDCGPATAIVLRLVWHNFLSQRHPRES